MTSLTLCATLKRCAEQPLHHDKQQQQQDKRSTSDKSNENFEETVDNDTESYCI